MVGELVKINKVFSKEKVIFTMNKNANSLLGFNGKVDNSMAEIQVQSNRNYVITEFFNTQHAEYALIATDYYKSFSKATKYTITINIYNSEDFHFEIQVSEFLMPFQHIPYGRHDQLYSENNIPTAMYLNLEPFSYKKKETFFVEFQFKNSIKDYTTDIKIYAKII